jgi:hypothetical protein
MSFQYLRIFQYPQVTETMLDLSLEQVRRVLPALTPFSHLSLKDCAYFGFVDPGFEVIKSRNLLSTGRTSPHHKSDSIFTASV